MATRKRILIIGGGPSSLTCAYHLTRTPELQQQFEVTILQMGWRLGGKGASGRNREIGDRIEEHGLHIMFGFYQNFFDMITEAYDTLGRPDTVAQATWREAFHPFDTGVVMDFYEGQWLPVAISFPRNEAVPGEGGALNDTGVYLGYIVAGAIEIAFGSRALHDLNTIAFGEGERWEHEHGDPSAGRSDVLVRFAMRGLRDLLIVARDVSITVEERLPRLIAILSKIQHAFDVFLSAIASHNHDLKLLFQGVDFLAALLKGIAADGVLLAGGYERIDKYDFGEWLVSHGMLESTVPSPPVRFLYDAAFSYADGESSKKLIAAGVAVRTLLRMGFTYKGAVFYKMTSGMGDTIMGPLYQILQKRGVRFGFFHKVKNLRLDPSGTSVGAVECELQVKLKSGDPFSYSPLFDCLGSDGKILPSWPSEPRDDGQIVDYDSIRGVNLESYYTDYKGVGDVQFVAGRDFDHVVFGSPVATIPFIARELYEKSDLWRQCADKVLSVQTVSLQAWFSKNLRDLGWKGPDLPLLSLFAQPLNTWSDMSQVLPRERWPEGHQPLDVSYFTGSQPGPRHPPLPKDDPGFPDRMTDLARRESLAFLRENITTLMPDAVDPASPPELDWSLLVDLQDQQGEARFSSQYWRSNCEPHERCTVAFPDTNQYRIHADRTGFANLSVAGDWTDNGFYVACLEGAVMGGILAARAASGIRFPIVGELIDRGLQPLGGPDRPEPPPRPATPRPGSLLDGFPPDRKIKVAVLGGGLGAIAAIWGILNSPVADRFEITVYQYGWRLGGKGASGRNREIANRIEEHGLHIWGGMYENAFEMIQKVYAEAGRPQGAPLSVWHDKDDQNASAFWPHNLVTLGEWDAQRWQFWNLAMPTNSSVPGDGRLPPSLVSYVEMGVEMLLEALIGAGLMNRLEQAAQDGGIIGAAASLINRTVSGIIHHILPEHDDNPHRAAFQRAGSEEAFREARSHAKNLSASAPAPQNNLLAAPPSSEAVAHASRLVNSLRKLRDLFFSVFGAILDQSPTLRHAWEVVDLGVALFVGCLVDDVLFKGFDAVDNYEFSGWISRHGATPTTVNGALVRGWHAFFFANINGDPSRPSLSAASALRTIFRYVFTYKGAFFWKMQAGMGDTIFAPFYEVAQRRGVKFKFFHRILSVSHEKDGNKTDQIQSIRVARQVDLAPGLDHYSPLFPAPSRPNGKPDQFVPSWPSEPLYDQIDPAQAKALIEQNINLESAWTSWKPVAEQTLELGRDFDAVILALSVGPIASVCSALLPDSPSLQAASGLATNQTIAAQFWLERTLPELGWHVGSTVGTVFAEPHNTWANMDQLLPRESWGDGPGAPKALVYVCGTYTDATPIPPFSDHAFPRENDIRVEAMTASWLNANMGALYPRASLAHNPSFDPSLLVAPAQACGEGRLQFQFFRGNIDPSERYVLSLPGSASQRPHADALGFKNLFGAGDWLYTGINAGCVEATVMGGLQASQAICGYPGRIIGDSEGGFLGGPRPLAHLAAAGPWDHARRGTSEGLRRPSRSRRWQGLGITHGGVRARGNAAPSRSWAVRGPRGPVGGTSEGAAPPPRAPGRSGGRGGLSAAPFWPPDTPLAPAGRALRPLMASARTSAIRIPIPSLARPFGSGPALLFTAFRERRACAVHYVGVQSVSLGERLRFRAARRCAALLTRREKERGTRPEGAGKRRDGTSNREGARRYASERACTTGGGEGGVGGPEGGRRQAPAAP